MKHTWIGRDIFRSNLAYGLTALGLFAVAVALAYFSRIYVYNAVVGPFPVDEADMDTLETLYAQDKYFVTLHTTRVFKTGLIGTLNYAPSVEYVVATNGRKAILIRRHIGHESKDYTGTLVTSAQYLSEARMATSSRQQELSKILFPFALEGVVPIRWKGYAIVLVVIGLAGTGCWLGALACMRTLNPLAHPYARVLERHGAPAQIAAELQADSAHAVKIGGSYLGAHWLWQSSPLKVFRLDEIVWVHRYVVVDRTGKTVSNSYRIFDCHGASLQASAPESAVAEFLAEISRRLPWIVTMINADVEQLWHLDRAAFLEGVAKRRAELQAQ